MLSSRILSLRTVWVILLDNPDSALGQDPSQLGQMRLTQAQQIRLPADAHAYSCSPDTGALIIDLVRCASRADRTAIRTTPACHALTIASDEPSRFSCGPGLVPCRRIACSPA